MVKLLLFAFFLISSGFASAQGYPAKPVRLIVPFPAGSTPDIVGRTLASRLADAWKQPVVVENKTGAGGNIGTAEAAHAAADGHTLLIGINGPIAVNKSLYEKLPFDPDEDLRPISLLATGAQVLAVHPSVPANDLREFVDYVRKNPGRLSYGSVGSGSASHLTMELLKSQAKLAIVHIPYRGFPPVVQDLLPGQIQATFAIIPAVLANIKAGKLKGLAVTSARRSELAPAIGTVAEQGFPQFDATAWIGLLAPARIPPAVGDKLAEDTQRAMKLPEVRQMLGGQGFEVVGSTPEEFARFIRSESAKWAAVIKATGAKPD
jgi:tripartite-type tricarboxylate transporter receptor subunit TctC